MEQYDLEYFNMKNDLGVLTEKTVRDLTYVRKGWVDRIFLPVGDKNTQLTGPQRDYNPTSRSDYEWYTQKEMWTGGYADAWLEKVICDAK
jgi:hypothetical protein